VVARLVLRRGADRRLRAGHPWIYRSEVADLAGHWSAGQAVDVTDAAGRLLGRGFYNPRPTLCCRLLTRGEEPVDRALFRRRLEAAHRYRCRLGLVSPAPVEADPARAPAEPAAYRLCWSEADGLPGLVVDRYGPVSVLQCLTLGMRHAVPWVVEALQALFPGDPIHRADDPTAARVEGFEPERGVLGPGAAPEAEVLIAEGACRFAVVPGGGHKTGFYLDQRDNRALVARHAEGRRVLDAFCYTGAFACAALAAGAREALLVESSAEALAGARRNLALNGLEARAALREGNGFDVLRGLEAARERFGLVVLDPPPFTRRKDALDAAARGYKEINLRALRLLEPGGLLATFSCSHHVTAAMFEEVCRDAAGDAGVTARVRATLHQGRDHPVLLTVPETRYLTGLLLEAV
jgi:23S rRNA (cytosine1962-C5)-methyltransferase